ncbi:hypothetical protein HBI38_096270 [Parastagonospora nodorum]|nr:hypothetical protein HBH75_095750 [Parastagonospora nodorum]KAH4906282.1 hypothetical protein HBI80_080480 [Parastagonospora nodorum]KAH5079655.1 hypothetical protein HBH95_083360 [Parastagonospora nodorum]KAH5115334.1 hypothetical protein HBH71_132040 [Parastagonospora nodorum]KAH5154624.1 hypothetical protein HBI73_064620 [Parastagonospora nodorum]
MDNDSDIDRYAKATQSGRSILIPLDSSKHPEVRVDPHMIFLLDQSCEDCREVFVEDERGGALVKSCLHLREVVSPDMFCPLCMLARMIWKHFSQDFPSSKTRITSIFQSSPGLLTLDLYCFKKNKGGDEDWDDDKDEYRRIETVQLRFTGLKNPLDLVDQPYAVVSSPVSPAGITKLKGWIQECDSTHTDCLTHVTTTRDFVPNRLIMLESSTNEHIRLVSLTKQVHYVALSYCWGSSEQSKTLKNNVGVRKGRIPVTELPRTLQDSIRMTQTLGIQYLWIDSLCIIQDDEHDWALESSKMADIYSNAWLVLAATGAPDCASGMLEIREPPFVIPPNQLLGTTACISVRRTVTHDSTGTRSVISQPLWKRAWAMQERELAHRIVHFLPDEFMWCCRASTWCECGTDNECGEPPIFLLSEFAQLDPAKTATVEGYEFGHAWITVLLQYSKLKITRSRDTLPALSGIARYVEHWRPGQYIAGLWERDIALQLAWYTCGAPWESLKRSMRDLDGPSFSWITCKGRVFWNWDQRSYDSQCTFLASKSKLATANPYGQILTSSLILRGRTLGAAQLTHGLKEFGEESNICAYMDDPPYDLTHLLDSSSHIFREHQGIIVGFILSKEFLSRTHKAVDGKHWALVILLLQRDATATAYKRIGLIMNISSKCCPADQPEETVTII